MAEGQSKTSVTSGSSSKCSPLKPLRSPLKILKNVTISRKSPNAKQNNASTKTASKVKVKEIRRKSEETESNENNIPRSSHNGSREPIDADHQILDYTQRRLSKNIDDMVVILKEIDSRLLTMSVKDSRDAAKDFVDSNDNDMKQFHQRMEDMQEAMISMDQSGDLTTGAEEKLPEAKSSDNNAALAPSNVEKNEYIKFLENFTGNLIFPEAPGFFSMSSPNAMDTTEPIRDSRMWIRKYTRPLTNLDLPSDKNPIIVDQAYVNNLGRLVVTVMVTNLDFHKQITCRWTSTIDWSVSFDFELEHVSNIPHLNIDLFRGSVNLPENVRRIEFAVRYVVKEQEFWDNNGADNFILERIDC